MTHYDEYYHWQKARELYDPHKYDYLHAEGPNQGDFEGWEYRQSCLCDACFLWTRVRYFNMQDFAADYKRMQEIMASYPGLDRIDAFIVMTSEEGDCIF